uniref:Thioredoxin domain-containing protein n=1 Tax=Zea mays TaxID=4577 RepID=B6T090_MAIZE|nr:hypothetical protein [Zea mays]
MASEQGVVIACHSKAEFDAHMTKAQEAGKLEVTAAYEVEAMPTFHFVKNGKTVATIVGARKDELLAQIEKHAAPAPASASA